MYRIKCHRAGGLVRDVLSKELDSHLLLDPLCIVNANSSQTPIRLVILSDIRNVPTQIHQTPAPAPQCLVTMSKLNFIRQYQGLKVNWHSKYLSYRASLTLTSLTVSSRVTLSTGTLVLVRSCVDTCPTIEARLASSTVVQIW